MHGKTLVRAVLIILIGFLLVACGASSPTPGPITDIKSLTGSYHGGSTGDSWLRFNGDGTYEIAFGESVDVLDNPIIQGNYRFEEEILVMVDTTCNNIEGRYEVTRLNEGQIQFKTIEDECWDRRMDLPGAADGWVLVE